MLDDHPIPWYALLESVYRRRLAVIIGTLAGALIGSLLIISAVPEYKAKARIQLTAQAVPGPRQAGMSNEQIQAELAWIRAPALSRSGLESNLGLLEFAEANRGAPRIMNSVKELVGTAGNRDSGMISDPSLSMLSEELSEEISAVRIGNSNLIEVSFTHPNPDKAAKFVNVLLKKHIERMVELNEQVSAQRFYEKEGKQALQQWQAAQAALSNFKERQANRSTSIEGNDISRVLAGLLAQRVAAETSVLELEARAEYLSRELDQHPRTIDAEWTVTENESVLMLNQRLLELEIARSEALSTYTPESKIVQDLNRQIEESSRLLEAKKGETLSETTTTVDPSYQALQVDLVETEAELTSARARIQALSRQIGDYQAQLSDFEETFGELERLENDAKRAKELYLRFAEQEEQARLSAILGESGFVNINLVDEAVPPPKPVPQRVVLVLSVSVLSGLILGIAAALFVDWLDPTVRSVFQASQIAGVPVLAELE